MKNFGRELWQMLPFFQWDDLKTDVLQLIFGGAAAGDVSAKAAAAGGLGGRFWLTDIMSELFGVGYVWGMLLV